VTQIVASLTAQLNAPRPPSPSPSITELDARERAQLAFQEQAIGFGDEYEISASQTSASVTRRWVAHRGELHEPLAPTDFYRTVGRPDLADLHPNRKLVARRLAAADAGIVSYCAASRRVAAQRRQRDEPSQRPPRRRRRGGCDRVPPPDATIPLVRRGPGPVQIALVAMGPPIADKNSPRTSLKSASRARRTTRVAASLSV
jgi:hypothetical protein